MPSILRNCSCWLPALPAPAVHLPALAGYEREVSNVHFRYLPSILLFLTVDFDIDVDSRICVIGRNGAAKSTLLKLLMGELEPTMGEIKRNLQLRYVH